jgi:ferric-dicitrate binding protein FerR (iron transport regulator)
LTSGGDAANFPCMRLSRAFQRTNKGTLLTGAVVIAVALTVIAVVLARAKAASEPREMLLADGTQIVLLNGTGAHPAEGFPQKREVEIRGTGEVFIKTQQRDKPLVVRTGLMVLTVDGKSALRASVSSERIGEQAEVLYGHVQAAKAYASPFNEPDILVGGEMSMVNRSIDLMEKETFDRAELIRWSDSVLAAAGRHRVEGK